MFYVGLDKKGPEIYRSFKIFLRFNINYLLRFFEDFDFFFGVSTETSSVSSLSSSAGC